MNKNMNSTGSWVQTERKAHEAWAALIDKAPKAAQLMHVLTSRIGDNNAVVISQKTLSELMKCSRRTVQRALEVLETDNWIEIRQIGENGSVNAHIINDRVAWSGARDGIRYSLFSATVVVSDQEQPDRDQINQKAELDPNFIEGSFIRDRLDNELNQSDDLVQSILANGQEVPILVRQHPNKSGFFQVAYGHRRLAALQLLNKKVRAVVRRLSDDQLVVAQGVENTARKDLSYIEKALFAYGLEKKGFSRTIIGQAVSLDKGELSKLISVARRVPEELIRKIGAAPAAGRRRWQELAELLEDSKKQEIARTIVLNPQFHQLNTDDRFTRLLKILTSQSETAPTPTKKWSSQDHSAIFSVTNRPKKVSIELSSQNGVLFGVWLSNHLDSLYEKFLNAGDG